MSKSDISQTTCPKCRATLPKGIDENSGSACPFCGLVFAKYRAAQDPEYRRRVTRRYANINEGRGRWLSMLLTVPTTLSYARFFTGVVGFVCFFLWGGKLALLDYRSGAINQSFLHGPLLIFHEAGHVIFRLFGEFLTVLGGTLAQLLMPVVLMVALLRQNHDTLGASLALWLLGISLLDVAPYVYDARAPQLILLNGATGEEGGHDWIYLLQTLGLLHHAHPLGGLVYMLGILTLLISTGWAATLLYKQWRILKRSDT